jgi:hypothetical protein
MMNNMPIWFGKNFAQLLQVLRKRRKTSHPGTLKILEYTFSIASLCTFSLKVILKSMNNKPDIEQ